MMQLETDRITIKSVTAAQLHGELDLLDGKDNTRAILSRGDEVYLQTAWFDNGFVIEKREGSEAAHFHAVPDHATLPVIPTPPKLNWFQRLFAVRGVLASECAFRKEDMIDIFIAYHAGEEARLSINWEVGFCDR